MSRNMSGMITSSSPDSGTSWRSAMITPPIVRIGAEIMMFSASRTSVWTWVTSLVLRVMRLAGPNVLTSTWENAWTLRKIALRDVPPEAHRDPGREEHGDDRGDHQRERDDEHEAARPQDVVGVALGDAVVDDVGVELGQVQVRDRLDQQQEQDEGDRRLVGREVLAEQADHAGATSGAPWRRSRARRRALEARRGSPASSAVRRGRRGAGARCSRRWASSTPIRRRPSSVSRDADDPPVVVVAAPLHEAALLHPVDDAR